MLGFVVAEHLYKSFPEMTEGDLTNLRAALVRTQTLSEVGSDLGAYILLGKGELASGGRARRTLLAQTFEAVVGAIFIDQGLEIARTFILERLGPELAKVLSENLTKDDKSRLQELAQAETGLTPRYQTVGSIGPDHAKLFVVEVLLGDRTLAEGRGNSKQEAEQNAAQSALSNWATLRHEGQWVGEKDTEQD